MTGWQVSFGYLVTIQPVGTEEARREALARWSALPKYIDNEIANLREGVRLKYTAPKLNVRIVIDQVNSLLTDTADSPFLSPADRDKDAAFDKVYRELFQSRLLEAFMKYRDFLQNEYLPAARQDIAIAANPDGAACYNASVRAFSSLPVQAKSVHEIGMREVEKLTDEMHVIAQQTFHTSDVPALMQRMRSDRQFMFKNRDDLIHYSQAALARAKAAMPIPRADFLADAARSRPASGAASRMAVHDLGGIAIVSFVQGDDAKRAVFIVDVWRQSGADWKLAIRYAGPAGAPDFPIAGAGAPPSNIPKKY